MYGDEKLLMMAAKAIGLQDYRVGDSIYPDPRPWNPLDDDGDALRLAVKLHIEILPSTRGTGVQTPPIQGLRVRFAEDGADRDAAARLAIVRAAAAIGSHLE
jgi:hypothetical protein